MLQFNLFEFRLVLMNRNILMAWKTYPQTRSSNATESDASTCILQFVSKLPSETPDTYLDDNANYCRAS